ncbi:HK97 family phage prohead protease [Ensifer adhaerens]|uniref:HK97 family phage prohead protease n=1 Tax=Ensifer adhaerens TaxID=106592 RepID=UPI001F46722E|nr:HK97 family phage prohead protease [Ensifer adhaerens]
MAKIITGYAVRFNDETVISGLFREKIAPQAFDKSLRERPDVLALYGHDHNRVLGRTTAHTLTLRPDRIGLDFSLTPDETTPDGQTAIGVVGRQDVRGCSFGFRVTKETWDEGDYDELPLRIVEEAELYEVSIVATPAYPTTSAELVRSDQTKAADSRRRAEAAMKARGIAIG